MKPSAPRDYRLPAILLVAVILRLVLVSCGGQFFFGDEVRYERGTILYQAVRNGDEARAKAILAQPNHTGFILVTAGVAGLQHFTAQFTPFHDWGKPENVSATSRFGSGWLALFSVLNIWLIYGISRRNGADATEAAWVALLMACSNTAFYYSRHFLPYDAALSCALAAILVGSHGRHSLATGGLAGACYHVYNGYWYLLPVVLALHVLIPDSDRSRMRRSMESGIGAVLALAAPVLLGLALDGRRYWQAMIAFSGTVTQGLYAEGWSLPWEYLWHSEGFPGLAVLLAIAGGVFAARRSGSFLGWSTRLGLAAVGMSYGWLVLFSVGLEKFVVYARTVKPFIPFLCLAGGWAAARLLTGQPRLARVSVIACCIVAALQFAPHFTRVFPRDVTAHVLRTFGKPKRSLSMAGSIYIPLAGPLQRPDLVLVNDQPLYPVRSYLGYPAGTTLLSLEHPLAYLPFQYEGHTPRERALLRDNDIQMRLIKLSQPADVPDDLPPHFALYLGRSP